MTQIFENLLAQRGLGEDFLRPRYENLFDPFLMQGVTEAVERIERARDGREKILIYGDYDADGVTASTVLKSGLVYFGCPEVEVLLPNRFTDGYGMNMPAISKMEEYGADLVITVDCGSGSGAVISEMQKRGIECIVTDHHEIPEMPEAALAVINPKRPDEKYGLYMAGVGVAFTLARALNMRKNGGVCDGQEKWLLDLVTIGTICDSMVLREENRIMSYFGMRNVLPKTRRVGLKELAKQASIDLSRVDTQAVGFQIGPRINAAGRLKSADLAFDLLNAEGRAEAFGLAQELNELNNERRKKQDAAVKEVTNSIDESDAVIVACGDWHEGIVGIIAGRLVEIYKKPAFALAKLEDGRLKGSGRSFGDFSLAEALQNCPEGLLLSGGGHAGACGLSLRAEDLEKFRKQINEYYRSLKLTNQEKYLREASDVLLDDFAEMTEELYDEIRSLEPFGEGNREPIFEICAEVASSKVLKEKHLSLNLKDGEGREMKMMWFFAPEQYFGLKNGEKVRVQFTLSRNEWRGVVKIEGQIISLERCD